MPGWSRPSASLVSSASDARGLGDGDSVCNGDGVSVQGGENLGDNGGDGCAQV